MNALLVLANETLLNIFSNFIPNKIKNFKNSGPPRIIVRVKNNIQLKQKKLPLIYKILKINQ